jgi:CheY-like chemotaxis protein
MASKTIAEKRYLTTGDVSRFCEVDINTVKSWIRGNSLTAFQTPKGHFRIEKYAFSNFLKSRGFPVDERILGLEQTQYDILIVEDENAQGALLKHWIQLLFTGFRLKTVNNGFDAYVVLQQERPRLLFVDINLPGFTGLEFLKAANRKSDNGETIIAVLSTHLTDDMQKELRDLNIRYIFNKPLKFEDIKKVLKDFKETLGV